MIEFFSSLSVTAAGSALILVSALSLVLYLLSACYPVSTHFVRFVYALAAVNFFLGALYLIANGFSGQGINEAVWYHVLYVIGIKEVMQYWEIIFFVPLFFLLMLGLRRLGRRLTMLKFSNVLVTKSSVSFKAFMCCIFTILSFTAITVNPLFSDVVTLTKKIYQNKNSRKLENYLISELPMAAPEPASFVYIYAESLERTFLDENRYPGLLPNLNAMKNNSVFIEGIYQAPMTDWTIAGITASLCGVPLAVYATGRNAPIEFDDFIPAAGCVVDWLVQDRYKLHFMGGADKQFAGKGSFFHHHGFDKVYGKQELQELSVDRLPESRWGVYDDALLRAAFSDWEVLDKTTNRYGLFILTLDTHSPIGHETPECSELAYGDGSNRMLNSVHCSDWILANFIQKMLAQSKQKNLVVIVASDHLMMKNYVGLNPDDPERTNLFMAFSKNISPALLRRNATTLDIAPTFLSLLGYDNNGFSLGRNLFKPAPTLSESLGREIFFKQLINWTMSFWNDSKDNAIADTNN
jgi:phosphoglycerol transferase